MQKILLVEDNELNRDLLSRRLERRRFQVAVELARLLDKTRALLSKNANS